MKLFGIALFVTLSSACAPLCPAAPVRDASSPPAAGNPDNPATGTSSSTDSSLPDAPSSSSTYLSSKGVGRSIGHDSRLRLGTRPFSQLAIMVNMGIGGLGVEAATPLATKIDLRGGLSFLTVSPNFVEESIPFNSDIRLRTASVGVDLYPYRSSFHFTPGFTFYNGNHANATMNIQPGAAFTIDGDQYISDVADPVHGSFDVSFGSHFAPSFTVGFGNLLRRTAHWTTITDFGIEYIGLPQFTYHLTGSTCDSTKTCDPILSDPAAQQDISDEQNKINQDIAPLRFFPILKVGIGYRFGHVTSMDNWR